MCLVVIGVLWMIRDILLYLFVACLLAGVLYPLARWAKKYRVPPGLAVIVAYIVLFGLLGLALSLLIPGVLEEIRGLLSTHGGTREWVVDAVKSVQGMLEGFGLNRTLQSGAQGLTGQFQQIFGNVFGTITYIFGGIVGILIVLVLSFYLVVEDSAIKDLFRNIIPPEYQEFASQLVWQVIDKLGAWFRGQMVLALIIGIFYFIAFAIIGVPYALLLAILGGLLEFIPYIGPFVAAIPALLLTFPDSPLRALIVLIVMVLIQQLENNVIVPKIMQKAVGLNPIISIVAFLVGASLFGIVGAIFAIPIATALSVAFTEFLRFRRERKELAI